MAVSNEVFIDIEKAISKKLRQGWRGKVEAVLRDVDAHLRKGNFSEAHRVLDNLDLSDLVDKAEGYIRTMFKASFLFGVSGVADPKDSQTDNDEVEETINKVVSQLRGMVRAAVEDSVREIGHAMIAEEELEQNAIKAEGSVRVRKASVDMSKVQAFNRKMRTEGDARVAAIAGLQNSRMASWGFTVEATIRGVSTYEVNEVMDSITCPVCREMHGKTFEVEHAKQKLERQLNVDDPAELKEMAPWPKQSKDALEELKSLSKQELQDRGLDTPPYHPGCRGVLRFKASSTRVEDQEITLTEVLPKEGASATVALAALSKMATVGPDGKPDEDGRNIKLPFTVATTKTKEQIEAVREKAMTGETTVRNVKLSRITVLDPAVDQGRVKDVIENGSSKTSLVVQRNGRFYVLDGLEVLMAAQMAGSETVPVNVYKPK